MEDKYVWNEAEGKKNVLAIKATTPERCATSRKFGMVPDSTRGAVAC